MTSVNLQATASDQANISDSAQVSQIYNFAWQHLKAAGTFRNQSVSLEIASAGKEFGDFFTDIRSYVSATILSATAALEATINELFIAPHCALRPTFTNFEEQFWGEKGIERKGILAKYKLALAMLNAQPLDKSDPCHENAWALIELRNSLIHYKPTWDPDRPQKADLIRVLNGKYQLSPFVNSKSDFLTMQSMSSGCAVWAVASVFNFLHAFDNRANLDQDKMTGIWQLAVS